MDKFDFLTQLRAKLWALAEEDALASVEYYGEMIDERMEEGLSEEAAVAAVGDLDEIVKNILADAPLLPKQADTTKTRRKLAWWEIVLLTLGFPVWGALVIAAAAVIFSVWISLWSVVICLYATAFALAVSAVGCIAGSFFMVGPLAGRTVAWGAALICAGLAILLLLLANLAAKGMVKLTKLVWNSIFSRKKRSV